MKNYPVGRLNGRKHCVHMQAVFYFAHAQLILSIHKQYQSDTIIIYCKSHILKPDCACFFSSIHAHFMRTLMTVFVLTWRMFLNYINYKFYGYLSITTFTASANLAVTMLIIIGIEVI